MTTPDRTQDERRIVESYQRVLDDVSRCAQAVRDGAWDHLAKTAEDLARHAAHLALAAGEPRDPGTRARTEVVVDAIASHPGSPAARALHPAQIGVIARTAMTDPFTHPGSPSNAH